MVAAEAVTVVAVAVAAAVVAAVAAAAVAVHLCLQDLQGLALDPPALASQQA